MLSEMDFGYSIVNGDGSISGARSQFPHHCVHAGGFELKESMDVLASKSTG